MVEVSRDEVIVSRADIFEHSPPRKSEGGEELAKVEFEELNVGDTEEKKDVKEEYEFRLFSARHEARPVVIRSPSPQPGEDGETTTTTTTRPKEYYFTDPSDSARLDRMEQVAVTGEDILDSSHEPYYALEMPWRVMHLAEINSKIDKLLRSSKRKRPNKKARIKIRQRKRQRKDDFYRRQAGNRRKKIRK